MYCFNCGNKVADTAKFCTKCGTKLIRVRPSDVPIKETVIDVEPEPVVELEPVVEPEPIVEPVPEPAVETEPEPIVEPEPEPVVETEPEPIPEPEPEPIVEAKPMPAPVVEQPTYNAYAQQNAYANQTYQQPRKANISVAYIDHMLADIRMLGFWCIITSFIFAFLSWVLAGFSLYKCSKLKEVNCAPELISNNRKYTIIGIVLSILAPTIELILLSGTAFASYFIFN